MKFATREEWLVAGVGELRSDFVAIGHPIPETVRVSVGWPRRGKKHTIGQCWKSTCADDGSSNIFITPALADPVRALDVLTHELCHAADDCESGHKGPFKRIATAIGLEGKMTATNAGPELTVRLSKLADDLGPYPHACLNELAETKQSTRLIKVACIRCGYIIRTSKKWIEVGLPTCCCGSAMEEAI